MTLPVTVDAELADELGQALQQLVADLTYFATDEEFGETPGLREAFAVVLRAVRELDAAVVPRGIALPSDQQLSWLPEAVSQSCSVSLVLDFEPARAIAEKALASSRNLNRLLGQIQLRLRTRKAPPDLVRRFGFAMGYLFTEVCMPIYRTHPELEPLWLRK
jgi:hypothetical protein